MNLKFPRQVWAGSHIKNAKQMRRQVINGQSEFNTWINLFNGRCNCYTTIYNFRQFRNGIMVDSSVVLDRAFLDFDVHDDSLTMKDAWEDLKLAIDYLNQMDYYHTMFFSGRGFHVFVFGLETDSIRNIQAFHHEMKKICIHGTLDDSSNASPTKLRRVPNTMNMNNELYCIPLVPEDLTKNIEYILDLAKTPRFIPQKMYGNTRAKWPKAKPIEDVGIEISPPKREGKLPIIPCLHNAVMVGNPSHEARVYLVQWFRDLLTLGKREINYQNQMEVTEIILDEIEKIASNEDVWLDWDKNESRKHITYIVKGGYNAPFCNTLISKGYCIGKCWRYPEPNAL